VTVLVVLRYLVPLDRPFDPSTWLGIGLALAGFAGVIAWQVRAILASDVPRLRAIQAVAIGLAVLLVLFASTYLRASREDADSFTEPLSRTDSLYFTIIVFATVGFGDIALRTEVARILTMIQMIGAWSRSAWSRGSAGRGADSGAATRAGGPDRQRQRPGRAAVNRANGVAVAPGAPVPGGATPNG
jgi:nitrate reductase gamma subunit